METDENTPQPATPRKKWGRQTLLYFRELSIVTIGILITVMITGMVNSCSRQKELGGMLSMVTQELRQNAATLELVKGYYQGELYIFELLGKHSEDIGRIPADTLEKYRYAVGALHSLDYKKDSWEVLKSSVLTQYIKKQGLMARLEATYGSMEDINRQLLQYSTQKVDVFYPMLDEMEPDEVDRWLNGSGHDWFAVPMKDRRFRRFLIMGPTVISPDGFEYCARTIVRMLGELEGDGY